ncbi:MAG: Vps62-related protein [Bacteroidota bacterium]
MLRIKYLLLGVLCCLCGQQLTAQSGFTFADLHAWSRGTSVEEVAEEDEPDNEQDAAGGNTSEADEANNEQDTAVGSSSDEDVNTEAPTRFTIVDLNTWAKGGILGDAESTNNLALDFAGDDDHVLIGQVPFYAGSFTVEGRFKGESGALFNVRSGSLTAVYAEIAGGKLRCIIRNRPANSGGLDVRSKSSVNDGAWHHFLMVKGDDDKLYLYLDGRLESASSSTIGDFNDTPYEVVVGMNVTSNTRYFKGTMDFIRFWNTKRMPGQSGSTGLVAKYDFNQGDAGGDNTRISDANDIQGRYNGALNGFSLSGGQSNFIATPAFSDVIGGETKLELLASTDYTLQWNDKGSRGKMDGSFYRPVIPEGYYYLGDFGQNGYGIPAKGSIPLVKPLESGALTAPLDYELIWKDSGSGARMDGSFWLPIAPDGYRALGIVCQKGYQKPSTDLIRCVREDLLIPGRAGSLIWNDNGTGAKAPFSAWAITEHTTRGISSGSFIGKADRGQPGGNNPSLFCLNPKKINWK